MSLSYVMRHGSAAALGLGFEFHGDTVFQTTPASETQLATAAISAWVRPTERAATSRYIFGAHQNPTNYVALFLDSSDRLVLRSVTSAATKCDLVTSATYDTSAWRHVLAVLDFTNATQGDRARLYVDGVRISSWTTTTYPADALQEFRGLFQAQRHHVGSDGAADNTAGNGWTGVLQDVQVMDDVIPTVNELGATVGAVWAWKEYAGSHGVNGLRYKFDNASDLGENSRKL